MAAGTALVDRVSEVAADAELGATKTGSRTAPFLRVLFHSGRAGLLDMRVPQSAVWADVLQSLRETGQPAYVNIDGETGVITDLLLPQMLTVESIRPTPEEDGVQVDLVISEARHFLRRSTPRYGELLEALEIARKRKATVLVTESLDSHEIIDVRLVPTPDKRRRR